MQSRFCAASSWRSESNRYNATGHELGRKRREWITNTNVLWIRNCSAVTKVIRARRVGGFYCIERRADIMAAILKHDVISKYLTSSIDAHGLEEQSYQISSGSDLKRRSFRRFLKRSPNKYEKKITTRRRTRNKNNNNNNNKRYCISWISSWSKKYRV